MSTSRDDPMDLGPFIQNWVLNNPFSNPLAPSSGSVPAVGLPAEANGAPQILKTTSLSYQTAQVSPTRQTAGSDGRASASGSECDDAGVTEDARQAGDEVVERALTPVGEERVKSWVLDNYRYFAPFKRDISVTSRDLLEQGKRVHSELKAGALQQVVKTLFPVCPRMEAKLGSSYQGLVQKPSESLLAQYQDKVPVLRQEVMSGLDLDVVSSRHKIPVEALARLVVWHDLRTLTAFSDLSNLDHNEQSRVKVVLLTKKEKSSLQDDSMAKDQKNSSKLPLKRPAAPSGGSVRVQPRRTAKSSHKCLGRPQDSEDEEEGKRAKMDETDSKDGLLDAIGTLQEEVIPPQESDNGLLVKIKEEPKDSDDESVDSGVTKVTEGGDSTSTENPESSIRVPNLVKLLKQSPAAHIQKNLSCNRIQVSSASPAVSLSSSTPRSSAIQISVSPLHVGGLNDKISQLHDQLTNVTRENRELGESMVNLTTELNQTKSLLRKRELQLSEIGAEFVELSNQFMLMSHRFRTVMQELNVPNDNSRLANGKT